MDYKTGSLADFAVDLDVTTVSRDDIVANRKPKTSRAPGAKAKVNAG